MKKVGEMIELCPKKALAGLALACVMTALTAVSGGETKYLLLVAASFLFQAPFRLRLEGRAKTAVTVLWCAAVSLAAVVLQLCANTGSVRIDAHMDPQAILLEWALYLSLALLACAAVRRPVPAMLAALCVYLVLPIANEYTYVLRGTPLAPADLLGLGTAANVASGYALFPMPVGVATTLALGAAVAFSGFLLPPSGKAAGWKLSCAALLGSAALLGCVLLARPNLEQRWLNEGVLRNGTHVNMLEQLRQMHVSPPDGYDADALAKLTEAYPAGEAEELPTIVVIMDESFADLSVLGAPIRTDREVTPFLSSLRENTVSGLALASVFGGKTANSEWEFLTASTMGCMPNGTIPFEQYVEDGDYSILAPLKALGYRCVGMHPCPPSNWKRQAAYEAMGFDETYFLEDFPQEDMVRETVSDREMFREMVRCYENKGDEPLFLFGVTIQNHGGYSGDWNNLEHSVSLEGYSRAYPDVEQYLSLLHETDRAMEELIGAFAGREDKVVVLFFGDHQPKLDQAFVEEVHGGPLKTAAEQALQYQVPFYIWANYDMQAFTAPCTSLNYLPVYLLRAAGLPLPPYQAYLEEAMVQVPAVNAYVYMSPSAGTFLPLKDAEGGEAQVLRTCKALQYNAVFDEEARNTDLFPYPGG